MINDQKANKESLSGIRDRITSLLESQSQKQSPMQRFSDDIGDISQSYLGSLSDKSGASGFYQNYDNLSSKRNEATSNLYNLMQKEVEQGNEDAAALDKSIKEVTGDDLVSYEKIANHLNSLPDQVDRTNANLFVIKAANQLGIKKAPDAGDALKRAQANYYNSKGGGVRLPVQALKVQNEALETIGTMNGINADLSTIRNQIKDNKLNLGLIKNFKSSVRNKSGLTTEESRNFDSFKRTLEKQRNDSLRLNKGVQTEGDSVRAWNELFENINDNKLVSERLDEIMRINERGADLKKLEVDQIRANYGADPVDYTNYENRNSAIKPEEVSEDDINYTAQKHGITPDEVRARLKK